MAKLSWTELDQMGEGRPTNCVALRAESRAELHRAIVRGTASLQKCRGSVSLLARVWVASSCWPRLRLLVAGGVLAGWERQGPADLLTCKEYFNFQNKG